MSAPERAPGSPARLVGGALRDLYGSLPVCVALNLAAVGVVALALLGAALVHVAWVTLLPLAGPLVSLLFACSLRIAAGEPVRRADLPQLARGIPLWRSLLLGAVVPALLALALVDLQFFLRSSMFAGVVAAILVVQLGLLLVAVLLVAWAGLCARPELGLRRLLAEALVIVARSPLRVLGAVALVALLTAASVVLVVPLATVTVALWTLVGARLVVVPGAAERDR